MDRGYVKLWRKSLDSDLFACPNMWRVWTWCLMKATYRQQHFPVNTGRGNTVVSLEPGQFIYGRHEASMELRMPGTTVEGVLARLAERGGLTRESVTHYSVITICNWATYQSDNERYSSTNRQPTVNQPSTNRHIQEGRECREERESTRENSDSPNANDLTATCFRLFRSDHFAAEWVRMYPAEHVREAMALAEMNGARHANYVNRILEDWRTNGKPDPRPPAERRNPNAPASLDDIERWAAEALKPKEKRDGH